MFSVVLLAMCFTGCGKHQQAEQAAATNETVQTEPAEVRQSQDDMKLMATVSIEHHAKQGKGPSDWDSFLTWAKANNPESVETVQRLREAGVVFFCEQEAKKATVGQSRSIFAYYPSVPDSGGVVALMIGSVTEMSAEDFGKMLEDQTKFDPDNVAKKSRTD
jgi:hypothetical protein